MTLDYFSSVYYLDLNKNAFPTGVDGTLTLVIKVCANILAKPPLFLHRYN